VANITITEAQAWAEKSKLDLKAALDGELEASVVVQVFAQIAQAYDTSSWVDPGSTPKLVRTIVSMLYVSWYYQRTYSEDAGASTYGALLESRATLLINGIIAGNVTLTDLPPGTDTPGDIAFYPTDTSSAVTDLGEILEDPSLGGPMFQTGDRY
jgi:hypothetical protein